MRRSRARARAPATSSGSTSTPASGGTNSGGPPIRVATTGRPHAIASSSAWPNGSIRRRAADDVGGARASPGPRRAARARRRRRRARRSSAARSGPSPTKVSEPRPSRANASASRTTFLRSVSEPTWTNAGELELRRRAARRRSARGRRPSRRPRSCRARREASPRARGAGIGDARSPSTARRTTRRVERRDARDRADVADVAPVRGDDERRAELGREQPGRDEEVRPDDVRAAPRRARTRAAELEEPALAAGAPVEHGELDLVPARREARCSAARRTSPRSGSSGPGYICETRRMRTGCSVSGRAAVVLAPLLAERRRRSRRPCSARRSASRIGRSRLPSPRAAAAPRASAAAAAAAFRSARTRAVRSTWRRSASGSIRCSSIGSSSASRVHVDADDRALARLDLLLPPERRVLDLALHEALLDRRDRSADLVDPLDQLPRARLELVGQRLDVVRAAERVGGVGRRRASAREDLLRAQRDPSRRARSAARAPRRTSSCAATARRRRSPRAPASRRGRRCSPAAAP